MSTKGKAPAPKGPAPKGPAGKGPAGKGPAGKGTAGKAGGKKGAAAKKPPPPEPEASVVVLKDVINARKNIKKEIPITPCMASHYQKEFVVNLYYKLETVHKTGSFKERGALHTLKRLPKAKQKKGIVLASLGNSATAILYHATNLNIPVTVVMPRTVSPPKYRACEELGGHMMLQGADLGEANSVALDISKKSLLTYIDSRDYPDMLAGHGTIALEILEQLPFVDVVLVPVGVGGLIAGVATVIKALKPSCLIYAVQTAAMPSYDKAMKAGKVVATPNQQTLADSIAVPKCGPNGYSVSCKLVDRVLNISEEYIARAMLHLSERESLVVEGAGACGLAVILANIAPELKLKHVVCIITGGNVDVTIYPRCLERGLSAEGRLLTFTVELDDDGKSLCKLLKLLKLAEYSLNRQMQEHRWLQHDTYKTRIRLTCECRNLGHALDLKSLLERAFPDAVYFDTSPFNNKLKCPCQSYKDRSYVWL